MHSLKDFREIRATKDDNEDENEWLVSYSDVVTLLLCFFVIFYNIDKVQDKNKLNEILVQFDLKNSQIANNPQSPSPQVLPDYVKDNTVMTAIKSIDDNDDLGILLDKKHFLISFKNYELFEFGSKELNTTAKRMLDSIFSKLENIKNQSHIRILGFTDPVHVKKKNGRWWSKNIELSVARSISAYEYVNLKYSGFELSVSGLGDNLRYLNNNLNYDITNLNISKKDINEFGKFRTLAIIVEIDNASI